MAQQQQQLPGTSAPYVHHAPKKVFIQKMREEEEEKLQRTGEGGASPGSSFKGSPSASPRMSPHRSPRGSPSAKDIEDLPSIPSISSSILSPGTLDFDFSQLQSPALFDDNKPIDLSSPGSGKHRGSKDFAFEGIDTLSPGSHSSGSQRSSPGSPTLKAERSSPPAKRGASGGKNLDFMNMSGKGYESKKPRLDHEGPRRMMVPGSAAHYSRMTAQKMSPHDDIEGLQRQMQTLYNQMPVSTLHHSMGPHGIPPLLVTAAITSHVNSAMAQGGAGVGFRPYLPDPSLLQAVTRASVLAQPHFPTPSTEAHLMGPHLPDALDGSRGLSNAERMAMMSQPLHSVVAERLSQMFGNKEGEQAYLNNVARRASGEVCSSDQLGERHHSAPSTGSNSPTSTFNPEPRGSKVYRELEYQQQRGVPSMNQQMVYHVAEEGGISSTCGPDGRSMHIKKEHGLDQRTLDNILDQKLQPLPLCSDSTKSDDQHSCQVCGDVAAGFHCGAYVCEACKVSSYGTCTVDLYSIFI